LADVQRVLNKTAAEVGCDGATDGYRNFETTDKVSNDDYFNEIELNNLQSYWQRE